MKSHSSGLRSVVNAVTLATPLGLALARMGRVNDHNLRRAVVYGCVLASFTAEGFGVTGLARVTRESILGRAEAIADMTRFSLSDTARILR